MVAWHNMAILRHTIWQLAVLWHTMTAWWMVEQYGSIKAHYGQSMAGDGES